MRYKIKSNNDKELEIELPKIIFKIKDFDAGFSIVKIGKYDLEFYLNDDNKISIKLFKRVPTKRLRSKGNQFSWEKEKFDISMPPEQFKIIIKDVFRLHKLEIFE